VVVHFPLPSGELFFKIVADLAKGNRDFTLKLAQSSRIWEA
jgi:hypothetical protein